MLFRVNVRRVRSQPVFEAHESAPTACVQHDWRSGARAVHMARLWLALALRRHSRELWNSSALPPTFLVSPGWCFVQRTPHGPPDAPRQAHLEVIPTTAIVFPNGLVIPPHPQSSMCIGKLTSRGLSLHPGVHRWASVMTEAIIERLEHQHLSLVALESKTHGPAKPSLRGGLCGGRFQCQVG